MSWPREPRDKKNQMSLDEEYIYKGNPKYSQCLYCKQPVSDKTTFEYGSICSHSTAVMKAHSTCCRKANTSLGL